MGNHRPLSSKGERTRRAVLDAAKDILAKAGVAAASQDRVAEQAGITQSALRHYFPTKEELIRAVFDDALEGYRSTMEHILLEPGSTPAQRLAQLIESHLDNTMRASDARAFETFAFWARDARAREGGHAWYEWLIGHYAGLILLLQPGLESDDARERAFQILTLTLGCWLTLGRSRPALVDKSGDRARVAIQRGVNRLVGVELPWRG